MLSLEFLKTLHDNVVHLGEFRLREGRYPIRQLGPHRRIIPVNQVGILRYGPLHIEPCVGRVQRPASAAEQPRLSTDAGMYLASDRFVRTGAKCAYQAWMGLSQIERERHQRLEIAPAGPSLNALKRSQAADRKKTRSGSSQSAFHASCPSIALAKSWLISDTKSGCSRSETLWPPGASGRFAEPAVGRLYQRRTRSSSSGWLSIAPGTHQRLSAPDWRCFSWALPPTAIPGSIETEPTTSALPPGVRNT